MASVRSAKLFPDVCEVDVATVECPHGSGRPAVVREAGPFWTDPIEQPQGPCRSIRQRHSGHNATLIGREREFGEARRWAPRRHRSPAAVHPHQLRHGRRRPIDDQHATRRDRKTPKSACVRAGQLIANRLRRALERQVLGVERLGHEPAGRSRGGQQPSGGVRGAAAALHDAGACRIVNRGRPDGAPRLFVGQRQKQQPTAIREKPRPGVGGFLRSGV